jgi:hypothetical protein
MSYDTLAKLGNYRCHPEWAVDDQRQHRTHGSCAWGLRLRGPVGGCRNTRTSGEAP